MNIKARGCQVLAIGLMLSFGAAAYGKDQFSYLDGKWTPVTGEDIGNPIWFHQAFGGWDAVFAWWGQTAISRSGGTYGSHVKIEGTRGDRCYYYISPISSKKMAWNLRHRDSGNCPKSVVLERDPLP
jgi:hypothetical protein